MKRILSFQLALILTSGSWLRDWIIHLLPEETRKDKSKNDEKGAEEDMIGVLALVLRVD